jgi:hypothetical protein
MKKELIKIYSHPRSGTHFLEAFIASNFYKGINLSSDGSIYYGHWSNKKLLEKGEPYHKLFGSHFFPEEIELNKNVPKIYIYRDVRGVIASIYNSKYFNQEKYGNISISDFLRLDIDWCGGLGRKTKLKENVVQHWYRHVDSWCKLSDENLLIIRYEDLKLDPEMVFNEIFNKYFRRVWDKLLPRKRKVEKVESKVGLNPNKATIDSWKNLFSEMDLSFINDNLQSKRYLYEEF